jgi:hypothetical protein
MDLSDIQARKMEFRQWFQQGNTKQIMELLRDRRDKFQRQLAKEDEQAKIYRLQGRIQELDIILSLENDVKEVPQNGMVSKN